MKINRQNNTSPIRLIKPKVITLLAVTVAFFTNAAFAQPCRTNSINISTGVNPATGAPLTAGSSDMAWRVIARSTDLNTAVPGLPIPMPAVINTSGWGNNPTSPTPNNPTMNSRWITFYHPTGSFYATTNASGAYWFTLEREFELCDTANLTINSLDWARDNYISNFRIVSKPTNTLVHTLAPNDPVVSTGSFYGNWNSIAGLSLTPALNPGKYAIQVTVHNFIVTGGSANPHGFHLRGTLSTGTNALLQWGWPNCNCEDDPDDCNDQCYWKLDANNILAGANGLRNIFGTLTNDDVRVQTNGTSLPTTFRGIIKGGSATTGGYFGWNTMSPTARWHVNCTNGNNETGISDIRFENLESGTGNILTIDANGYVYNSGVGIGSGSFWGLNGNSATSSNFLGTTNNQDLRIYTNSLQRAVFAGGGGSTGGFMGINTTGPTARLHVNCNSGNEGFISDIRFEDLESGTGNQLAIDASGYVYDSGIPVGGGPGTTGWDVTGNTITGGNNLLGTNSNDDIQIITNFLGTGSAKGIFSAGTGGYGPNDDGRFGWMTTNPTAHLHINCRHGNPDGGPESDVRFEELETGQGEVLVINDQGYVFNSRIKLNDDGSVGGKMSDDDAKRVEQLEAEVASLKNQLQQLLNCCTATNSDVIKPAGGSALYQNTPNPFGKETVIEYYAASIEHSAFIMIYDLNGRELSRYPIAAKGKGKVTINGENLAAGMYMYSLVIDGKEIDSKRMAFTK